MNKRVKTVNRSDTVKSVVKTLSRNSISGCPVIDNKNKVVGIVTQSDIIKMIDVHSKVNENEDILDLILAALKDEKFDSMSPIISKVMQMPVKKIMNDCITISLDEDVYEAAKIMNKKNIRRLPVVKNKILQGIITKSDMMKLLEKL